jgi:hypothetical protein
MASAPNSPAPTSRRFFIRVILALASGGLLAEVSCRMIFPLPPIRDFNRALYMPLDMQAENKATTVGRMQYLWDSDPDGVHTVHQLNRYGFRDHEWETQPSPSRTRVAFIGDSFVEGNMAESDQTIPSQFHLLAQRAAVPVDTMNLGIGGLALDGALQLTQDAIVLFRPSTAFLVLYANDLPAVLNPLPPPNRFPRRNGAVSRCMDVIEQRRIGAMIPIRGTQPRQRFLVATPHPANPWSDPTFVIDHHMQVSPPLLDAMRRGMFNPWRVLGDLPYAETLSVPVDPSVHRALAAVWHVAKEAGTDLHLAYLPSRGQVSTAYWPYEEQLHLGRPPIDLTGPEYQQHARELQAACQQLGISFIDLTPPLREAEALGQRLYWNYDDHMRPEGYRQVAQLLFSHWTGSVTSASSAMAEAAN